MECVAACDLYDRRHELAKEIAGKSIRTTRRYKELLDDKSMDAIIVAVPDHWHKQIVVDTVAAGKDVYSEKPLSHSAADGVAMVEAAKKSDRIVQIGSQRTSCVLCAKAKELYDSGAIGELSLVEVPTDAMTPPASGNILPRRTYPQKISTGTLGSARHLRGRSIPTCSPAGVAGKNTEPVSPAT